MIPKYNNFQHKWVAVHYKRCEIEWNGVYALPSETLKKRNADFWPFKEQKNYVGWRKTINVNSFKHTFRTKRKEIEPASTEHINWLSIELYTNQNREFSTESADNF